MKSKLIYFLLLIIPVFVLITSVETIQTRGNTWYGGDYDPAYCYLLNSLNNAYLKPVGHTDHPGTTSQVYGAIVLRVYHLLDRNEKADLKTAVLKDPERHILIMDYSFLALNCIFLFMMGLIAQKAIKCIWLVLLLQIAPFFSSVALYNGLTRVSQEPMLFFSAMLMLALVIWQFSDNYDRKSNKNILMFGLITGMGMTSKIIFFPLVFLPLMLIPEFKNKIRYVFSSIGAFALFTFPIWAQYKRMFGWFYIMLTHSGTYGTGSEGLIDKATYLENIRNIVITDTVFSVIVSLSLIVLLIIYVIPGIRNILISALELKVLQATVVVQILGLLLVAKMPSIHYMLPYSSLLVLNVFCMLSLYRKSNNKFPGKYFIPVVVSILLIVLPYSGIKAKNNYYSSLANMEYEASVKKLSSYNDSYAKVYCLPSSSVVPSLFFGNAYARRYYSSELAAMYPNSFIYEAPSHKLMSWDTEISFSLLKATFGNKILILNQLRGYPFTPDDLQYLAIQGFKPEDVFGGKFQTIIELKAPSNDTIHRSERPLNEIICDAEEVSKDQLFCISRDGYRFEMGGTRTNEKAHRGKFAAKLTPAHPYAMTLTLDNLKPGATYEVSAWRWGGDKDGYLVAGCEDSKIFYTQGNSAIPGEANGWRKVLMDFTLPNGISGKKMKIFAWNSGQSTMYFDDLEIIKKN